MEVISGSRKNASQLDESNPLGLTYWGVDLYRAILARSSRNECRSLELGGFMS